MKPRLKFSKRTIFLSVGILTVLFVLNLLLAAWAKNSFPDFVKQKNDTAYNFEYGDIDFSFFGRSLSIRDVKIFPKPDSAGELKVDFSADIRKIKISGVDFIRLIRKKELTAGKIQIIQPDIRYYRAEKKEETEPKTKFQNSIDISHFILKDSNFKFYEADRKTLISSVENLNLDFRGVRFDRQTAQKKIPFGFSEYRIGCDSFFWQINPSQELRSRRLEADSKQFSLLDFSIVTTDSLANVNSVNKEYRLLPSVSSKEFAIEDMDWGFDASDQFYFKSSKIRFDSARVSMTDNKNTTRKEKKLNHLIPFELEISRISVKNSEIEVENSVKVHEIDLEISKVRTDQSKKLEIDSIFFDKPLITLIQNQKVYKTEEVTVSPFKDHVGIGKLKISRAGLRLSDPDAQTLTDVSKNLNLTLEKIEVLPKPVYDKNTKSDNFTIRLAKMSLKTDSIIIGSADRSVSKKETDQPLIPVNFEISELDFSTKQAEQTGKFKISPVKISGVRLKNEILGGLNADLIRIGKSKITAFSSSKKKKNTARAPDILKNEIRTAKLEIEKSNFRLIESGSRTLLSLDSISAVFDNAVSGTGRKFGYDDVRLTASGLKYHPKGNYDLLVSDLGYENQTLKLRNFEFKPKISKSQFAKSLKKQKDYYSVKTGEISIQKPNINFSADHFSFSTPLVMLNSMDAYIYRTKIPPDDTSKKKMYSQLLREMKFGLNISKLSIRNSKLVYEEETATSSGAGKLTFNHFTADISNLSGGYKKSRMPDVKAVITANFMNDARLKVNWSFNPMNRNEDFRISGSIFNFDAKRMTPFVKPYLHATVDGSINEVEFDFKGNNVSAAGNFGIKYNNLKVTLYNPRTGKPRNVVSKIGNLALKSNTCDQISEVQIKPVNRKQDKSFFNFLWLCVQQGLKQTVLII